MNNIALLVLRIVFASSMLYGHGLGKLQKLIDGTTWNFFYDFIPYPTFDINCTDVDPASAGNQFIHNNVSI